MILDLHQQIKCPRCELLITPRTIGRNKEFNYLSKCPSCNSVWLTYIKWGDGLIAFVVPPLEEGSLYNREMDDVLHMRKLKFMIQGTSTIS